MMYFDDIESVKYIIENGADVNTKLDGFDGHTPLMDAIATDKSHLVEHGADVNVMSKISNSTPLIQAIKH